MVIGASGQYQFAPDNDREEEKYICYNCGEEFPESELIEDRYHGKWTGYHFCKPCFKKFEEEN